MIERNKHPSGRVWNMFFGLCEILDGCVRLFSFGFLHTRLLVTITRLEVQHKLKKLKKARENQKVL